MTLVRNLCCLVTPHLTDWERSYRTLSMEKKGLSRTPRGPYHPAERNYAQLDKEGAAVIFGLKKFHQYLYGQKFKIFTDHKPLLGLFKAEKAVPTMASPKIQRWALLLAAYDYELVYREGCKHGNADGLSRLPLPDTVAKVPIPGETILLMSQLEVLPVGADQIADWTASDPVLQQVLRGVQQG